MGFRDGDSEFVELVGNVDGGRLTIPTLTDKDRSAVLAFLDAKGLRRLD